MVRNSLRSTLRFATWAIAAAGLAVHAGAQVTVRASLGSGVQGNGASAQASISGDGRYVAFSSASTNLAGLTSGSQIFVRDLVAGTTRLASVNSAGTQGNGDSFNPRISPGGRFVVFSSDADNLDGFDLNGSRDVFVRDLVLGTTTRVSVGDDESEGNGVSDSGWMSGDGNLVVFRSVATNLVAPATTDSQVFVRNIAAGTTTLVSRANGANGAQGDGFSGVQPSITPDGRYVGFSSNASNLVPGDTNGVFDVYVRDTWTNTNQRISLAINGAQGFQDSYNCSMSDDGRYVAFVSNQGFVNGDTNGLHDVFVRDTVANTMTRVSVDSQGKQATGGASGGSAAAAGWGVRISGDGRFVAFQSLATNLVKKDTNGLEDVFVRDRLSGTTTLLSVASGNSANGASTAPSLSTNGQYVAFVSAASNLVTADTNGVLDAFVRGPAR